MAEHDLVDVLGGNRGVGERVAGDPSDKALDGFAVKFAEWAMRPSHDAGGHVLSTAEV